MSTGLQKLQTYINQLNLKHTKLERAIQIEETQLYPNPDTLATLNKNKGLIKEQMDQLQARVDAARGNTTTS